MKTVIKLVGQVKKKEAAEAKEKAREAKKEAKAANKAEAEQAGASDKK